MSWSELAVRTCAGYIFLMRRKKQPKYVECFWMQRVFSDGVQHGHNLLHELNIQEGSGFRNFIRMTESDFETLPQETVPRNERKDTKYHKAIPASIRLAMTLRYLATGDSLTSLMYTSKFLSNQYPRLSQKCVKLLSLH
jgi:hypothetical protein